MGLSCRLLIAGTMQQMALIAIPRPIPSSLTLSFSPARLLRGGLAPRALSRLGRELESIFRPRGIEKEKEFRKVRRLGATGRPSDAAGGEGGGGEDAPAPTADDFNKRKL